MGHTKTSSKKPTTRPVAGKKSAQAGVRLTQAQRVSQVLRTACDPTRLHILFMLSDGETSVQAIVTEVGQSQPEVSYHLALLRHTNLVASRRESGRYLYSLTGVGQDFADHLQRLMSPKPVSRRVVKVRAEIDTVPRKDVRETMDDAKVRLNSSETSSWEDLNRHRLNLIDKEVDQELTVEEEAELHVLQQKADDYLDIVAPLPFEILDKLRECAQEDGLDVSFPEEE